MKLHNRARLSVSGFARLARFAAFEANNGAGAGSSGTAVAPPPAPVAQAATPPVAQAVSPLTALDIANAVRPLVQQGIADAVAPLRTELEAQRTEMQRLAQPVSQSGVTPAQVFQGNGRAPAGIVGERDTSRGYSFARAVGVRQGFVAPENAKVEMEVHNRLYAYYQNLGMSVERQSLLAPFALDLIPEEIDDRIGVKGFLQSLRQMVYAGVAGADNNEVRAIAQRYQGQSVQQALSIYDDTALGVLLGPTSQGEMIELIRAREVFSRVGATQIALAPNGRMSWPKQTGASTAYWVGESAAITASEPATGNIEMSAKKLAVLIKAPNELFRFSTTSLDAFLRMDMARQMSLKADSTMIDGVGTTTSPKGLLRYSGIHTHVATGVVHADGDTFGPDDPTLMIAEIEDNNHDPEADGFAFVMRPKSWSNLLNKRADAVSAADGKGMYLFAVNREDITQGKPNMLQGHPVIKSTQVPNNRTKGSGTDLVCIIGGIFRHWLIGRYGVMEFATTNSGDTPFANDQTWVRAIQHMDAAPRYEDAFVLCDDLLATA